MSEKPNILLITCDQMRPFELGCYGHPLVETPNIDRLAASGVRFETACTTNPVCTPARASMISGQFSRTCQGMLGCTGEPATRRYHFPDTTLAERLSTGFHDAAGILHSYDTALTGKWHIGVHPRLLGFNQAVYPKVYHLNTNQRYYDIDGNTWIQEGYCPPFELETSCEFMRRERDDNPFFLFHNISLPHMPYFDVPTRYRERYHPDEMLLRPNVWKNGKLYFEEEPFLIYLYDYLHYREHREEYDNLPDGYDLRNLYADYCGLITAVDEQVGQLLDCLEENGQIDNTIVIFTSDHGDNLGSHHLWNKVSVNDEAIRIPFIISWPKDIKPAVVNNQVASLADITPTILSLAGLPVPAYMTGNDLSPVLHGMSETINDGAAYIENLYGEIGIRTQTHFYAVMTGINPGSPDRVITDDAFQFFDLRDDPYQMNNLAKTGEQSSIAADLRNRVITWNNAVPWMHGTFGGTYGQG